MQISRKLYKRQTPKNPHYVQFSQSKGNVCTGKLVDISVGGMKVATNQRSTAGYYRCNISTSPNIQVDAMLQPQKDLKIFIFRFVGLEFDIIRNKSFRQITSFTELLKRNTSMRTRH
jgi:c-di-GMP-binding flagellar brake protein YcgR